VSPPWLFLNVSSCRPPMLVLDMYDISCFNLFGVDAILGKVSRLVPPNAAFLLVRVAVHCIIACSRVLCADLHCWHIKVSFILKRV
jgi:hypothetical protein